MNNLRSRRIDHHFELYANGRVWLWKRSVDFQETDSSFIGRAKRHARLNKIGVKIRIRKAGILVQFIEQSQQSEGE
jgi:hypothetical protein